jgi:hypothetical protein
MNNTQEESFQILTDYFNGRRYKILYANSPAIVRAEFGGYMALSISTGTAKGEVEASITKANNGSYANLHFNFMKEYMIGLIGAILCALVTYGIGYWSANASISKLPAYALSDAWGTFNAVMIPVAFLAFVFVMLLEGYYVSKTKKKFVAEFENFAKSLPNTKMPITPINQ